MVPLHPDLRKARQQERHPTPPAQVFVSAGTGLGHFTPLLYSPPPKAQPERALRGGECRAVLGPQGGNIIARPGGKTNTILTQDVSRWVG